MTDEDARTLCPADSRGLCAPPHCDGYLPRETSGVHPMLRPEPAWSRAWRGFLSALDDGGMAPEDIDSAIGRLQELARSEGYSDGFTRGWESRGKTDALLAARGDAATPTEVEWGVREPNGSETHYGAGPVGEGYSRNIVGLRPDHFTLIQRTASAWREVEGGGQRG